MALKSKLNFMKRRVHIEILTPYKVKFTTPFLQKTFTFTKEDLISIPVIDLISLKVTTIVPKDCKFYALIHEGEGYEKPEGLYICPTLRESRDDLPDISFGDSPITIDASVSY